MAAVSRRAFVAGVGGAGVVFALMPATAAFSAAAHEGGAPAPMSGLTGNAVSARRCRYGTAIRAQQIVDDPHLSTLVVDNCDWVTPEIDMKWNVLQPGHGVWNFAPSDEIVRFAHGNGKQVRGHTLLWEQSTPDWALAALTNGADWSIVDRHIGAVLRRYAADVCEWDVVNEPIDTENGAGTLRRTIFQRAFGNDYIARALRSARAHAPAARLMINDYGLEYTNHVDRDRRKALLTLLASLRRDGVPIDGVGIQAHLDCAKGDLDAPGIRHFLREIGDLGLTATITELDIKEADKTSPISIRDHFAATHVQRYLDVVLAEPAVHGLVTWGLSDRDSWLQTSGDAMNRGLPFDRQLAPKPLYYTLQRALSDSHSKVA